MGFDLDKKNVLGRVDKSKKQSVDEDIVELINNINEKDNYYTTSSCSGRISVWREGDRKDRGEWLFVTHNPLTDEDRTNIKKILENPPQETLWLRAEPFIIHITCRTADAAKELLTRARQCFKKSSILAPGDMPTVEIKGSSFLDMPLSQNKELKLQNIDFFLDEANKKLKRTKEKTKDFMVSL